MNPDGNRFKITFTFQPSHFLNVQQFDLLKRTIHGEAERLQPLEFRGGAFGSGAQWFDMSFIFESLSDAERLQELGTTLSILCEVALNPVLKNLCDPDSDPSQGYKCPNGFNYSSRGLHDIQCPECPPRRPSE